MAAITHYEEPASACSSRLIGATVTLGLHAIVAIGLLQYEPIRSALIEAAPIMVSLVTPVPEKPREKPKPVPIKRRVEQAKPAQPQPTIAVVSEIPVPAVPTPPPAQPTPVEIAAPRAMVADAPAPISAPPLPVIPPGFDADYLENPRPAYPAMSRRLGEQGRVMLRVLVNVQGSADKVELRTSSGSMRLDDAALDTVKRWRFVPARQGNQPVAAWVLIPITFALKG